MTYEELTEALLDKGYTKSKIDSNQRFIKDIAEIIAGSDEAIEIVKTKYQELCDELYPWRDKLGERELEILKKEQRIKEIEEENEALKPVKECETAEARDKVRLAAIYKKSIQDRLNEYQYTEYVKGLGKILASGRGDENDD